MRWTKRRKTITVAVLIIILAGCVAVIWHIRSEQSVPVERFAQAAPESGESGDEAGSQSSPGSGSAETSQVSSEPYQSPVDFQELQETNSDIYAWLSIPGTDISYPILQHAEEDSYYLTHDAEREESRNGALFTEGAYNDSAFDDPVTVVYGHNMQNGLMFSRLQEYYSDAERFEEHSEIIVYRPDGELHFKVFAAVPYDERHILYNYDFTDKRTFHLFFDDILSVRTIEASFAEDAMVQSGERVLILSTCLNGNSTKRFLVCAKRSEYE